MTEPHGPRERIEELERLVLDTVWEELRFGPIHSDGLLDQVRDFDDLDDLAELVGSEPEMVLDDLLLSIEGVWTVAGGLVARLDVVLDGTVFTHRLTEAEIDRGEVAFTPDLTVVDWAIESDPLLEGEGRLELRSGGDRGERPVAGDFAFAGPEAWLDGFATGDLIGFRRVGRRIRVERVEDPGAGESEAAAIAEAFATLVDEPGIGEDVPALLMQAIVADEELRLFRSPVVPITDLLPAAGLENRGELVGPIGAEFEDIGAVRRRQRIDDLAGRMGFEDCCRQAFDRVLSGWAGFTPADRPGRGPLLHALAHGAVAPALASYSIEFGHSTTASLDEFAAYLAEQGGPDAAAAEFLRGVHAEEEDDALAAEAHYQAAVHQDPGYNPAARQLSRYRLDRGQGLEALKLLRRGGVPEDSPDAAYLAQLFERRGTGRNEPCPCGSGKKFKACCLVDPQLTAAERIDFLTRRIIDFMTTGSRQGDLFGLALSAASDVEDDDELVQGMGEMVHDPFILDVALFEGGGLEEYLEVRGPLLTEEDRATLEGWAGSPRALYEVVEARPGEGMTLRDTRTGGREHVTEVLGSQGRSPGDLLLGRVVTVGDTRQLIGHVLAIDLRQRDSLLRLLDRYRDADSLASWYGSWRYAPAFANREGDPMVFCEARLMPDPGGPGWPALAAHLDDAYRSEAPDRWVETVEVDGEELLRATLAREDDDLVVHTNSEERMTRVLESLSGMVVLSESRQPATSIAQLSRMSAGLPEAPAEDVSEEARRQLEQWMREKEEAWVDESIPALGGMTPRQAVDDPTRREDLLSLLRSLERGPELPANAMAFDPARLRELLGIDEA